MIQALTHKHDPVFSPLQTTAIAALCVVILGFVILMTLSFERRYNNQSFEDDVQDLRQALSYSVSSSEGVITTLSGLFQASDNLERHELAAITEQLFDTYPFIPHITRFQVIYDDEIADLNARMLDSGVIGFTLQREQDGIPDSDERIAPIIQIEPNDPLLSHNVGVDLLSQEGFATALHDAITIRSGTMLIPTWSEGEKQLLAMLIPTYYGLFVPTDSSERDAQLEGGFIASIDLKRSLHDLIKKHKFSHVEVSLRTLETGEIASTAVYSHGALSPAGSVSLFAPFSRQSELIIGNRALSLSVTRGFKLTNGQMFVLLAATFATLMLFAVTLRISSERIRNNRQLQQLVCGLKEKQQIIDIDQDLARKVFAKIVGPGSQRFAEVDSWSMTMNGFSGDLVLTGTSPQKQTYVLICDFTGHGLPAALGALPVSAIFNAMVAKGCSIGAIVSEMNTKLLAMLPTNIFCCCTLIVMGRDKRHCAFWNGGLPPIFRVGQDGKVVQRFSSPHLPLGILHYQPDDVLPQALTLEAGDSLYVHTDGLSEATNSEGTMFSERGLQDVLTADSEKGHRINAIRQAVESHLGNQPPGDDITIIEVTAITSAADAVDKPTPCVDGLNAA